MSLEKDLGMVPIHLSNNSLRCERQVMAFSSPDVGVGEIACKQPPGL